MTIMFKAGREVLDPYNRVVTVLRVTNDDMVEVRLAGPYAATTFYSKSCLREVPESTARPAGPAGVVLSDADAALIRKRFNGSINSVNAWRMPVFEENLDTKERK